MSLPGLRAGKCLRPPGQQREPQRKRSGENHRPSPGCRWPAMACWSLTPRGRRRILLMWRAWPAMATVLIWTVCMGRCLCGWVFVWGSVCVGMRLYVCVWPWTCCPHVVARGVNYRERIVPVLHPPCCKRQSTEKLVGFQGNKSATTKDNSTS